MSQFTKQAIINAFTGLLNERPLSKITVTDIVEKCGINRNTFYYYFSDIYSLLDEVFMMETKKITEAHTDCSTWQQGFFEAVRFADCNRRAIFHVYDSINRSRLESYLYDVVKCNMFRFVEKQTVGMSVSEEDANTIASFYAAALVGLVMRWLGEGMKTDPEAFISRLGRLLDGNIRASLDKVSAHKKPNE